MLTKVLDCHLNELVSDWTVGCTGTLFERGIVSCSKEMMYLQLLCDRFPGKGKNREVFLPAVRYVVNSCNLRIFIREWSAISFLTALDGIFKAREWHD